MEFKLENSDGLPWTASIGRGWLFLIVLLTAGLAQIALGIYLALWIRSKGRSALPLLGFVAVPAAGLLPEGNPGSTYVTIGALSLWVILLASIFGLRHEIRRYFREAKGIDQRISPVFTFLLGPAYLNYCLNPPTLFDDEVIALDIDPDSAASAKIAK